MTGRLIQVTMLPAASVVIAEEDYRELEQLRGTLSLAEEGLANYAQEVERLSTLLGMVAVHMEHPQLGGLSESQRLAISEWYEVFRESRVGVPQTGDDPQHK